MNDAVKTLGFLLVAGGLVTAAWFTRGGTPSTPEEFSLQGKSFFPKFEDWGAAASMEVYDYDEARGKQAAFKVEFKDGVWRIPSKDNYPADAEDRLSSVAGAFAKLERGQLRSRVDASGAEQSWVKTQKECGVIDPRGSLEKLPTEGRGRRIVLKDAKDKVLADLIVGEELEGSYGKRFVRRADEKQIYTADLDLELSTKFEDWIDTDLLKLDVAAITSVTVRRYTVDEEQIRLGRIYLDEEDTIVLGQANPGEWTVDKMREDQQASMSAIDSMTETLSELTIKDVMPFDVEDRSAIERLMAIGIFPTGSGVFSNEGELHVCLNTGVRYNLRFGEVVAADGDEEEEGLRRYLLVDAEPFYEGLADPTDPKAREEADKKVSELNRRFGGWFYVIGAQSFGALRPARDGLLEPRAEPIDAEPGLGGDMFPPVNGDDGHGHDDHGHEDPEDSGGAPPKDGGSAPPQDGGGGDGPPKDGGSAPPKDGGGGDGPPEDGSGSAPQDSDPPVETPPAEPPVETPPAETPPAETPAEPPVETPPAETPPAETPAEPPVETPPAETPPAETPAEPSVETPPAETPPAETPPAETPAEPPVETPPAETPVEPPAETPPAETPPAETPKDGEGLIEEAQKPGLIEEAQKPGLVEEAQKPGLVEKAASGGKGHTYHRAADHWTKQAEGADTALNLAPDYAGALFLKGEASLRLGKHDVAQASLEQVVAKDAKHARAFALLGEVHLALGNLEAAVEHAQHAVELAPKSVEAARVMAEIGLNQQDAGPARDHAARGLTLDPLDVDLLFLRGDAHAKLGDQAAASADWKRGLELLPDHPRAAEVRQKLGE